MKFVLVAYFKLTACKGMKLLERLKFDGGSWGYLRPEHQLVCMHHPKFNKVYEFAQYHQFTITLSHTEFYKFYSLEPSTNRLMFKNYSLLEEHEYANIYSKQNDHNQLHHDLHQHHAKLCSACKEFNKIQKPIRRRKKLDHRVDLPEIAYWLGRGRPVNLLMEDYDLSHQSIYKFKSKLRTSQLGRKPKVKQFTSLSDLKQKKIVELILQNPMMKLKQIKSALKLDCHYLTIRNFLRSKKFFRALAKQLPLVSPTNMALKEKLASFFTNVSVEDWSCVIFCDEKTFQSYHNGRIYVYRRRGDGMDRRYRYRRNRTSDFKVNCFGYVTSSGIGDIFVFEDKTNTAKFINYFNNSILPSIVKNFGDRFVLMLDNASFHVSKMALEYFLRAQIPILSWPPQSPEWNIVEDIWGIVQRLVNELVISNGPPKSKQQLASYVFSSWYSVKQSTVNKLYASLPKRFESFLKERQEIKAASSSRLSANSNSVR